MDAVIARVDKRKSHDTAFSEDGRHYRKLSRNGVLGNDDQGSGQIVALGSDLMLANHD